MHLITFEFQKKKFLGVKEGDYIINLEALSSKFNDGEPLDFTKDMLSFIRKGEKAELETKKLLDHLSSNEEIKSHVGHSIHDIKVLAPIANPGKLVCVGNNYMDHCREQNVEPPTKPMIFSKWASCIIAPGEEIQLPLDSHQVDYEAELAVVIGKKAKNIAEEEALNYVFGYTILNDVSARDVQFEDVQWVRGKSYDTFAPMGPAVVTKDDVDDPHNLEIKLEVNGRVLQDSNTNQLIFNIPYIISYLSKGFTFEPGDIIATGTPHGVGVFRDPQVFLQSGDRCTIHIEKIGTLTNKVK